MGKPKGTAADRVSKPKAVPMKVVKPKEKAIVKKPAMANSGEQGMINQSIEQMKAGVGLDMNESRDKGKALKYAKMKDAGSLPEHIVSLVESESKKAVSARQFKTMAINRLFRRDKDGQIQLAMDTGLFTESCEVYSRTYAKKKEKALPKSIVCGLYFQNDTKSFDAALAAGDLEECEEDGKKYYSFKEYTVGKVEGKNNKHSLKTESAVNEQVGDTKVLVFSIFSYTTIYYYYYYYSCCCCFY